MEHKHNTFVTTTALIPSPVKEYFSFQLKKFNINGITLRDSHKTRFGYVFSYDFLPDVGNNEDERDYMELRSISS